MVGLGLALMKMGNVQLQVKVYNPRDLVVIKKARTHRTVYLSASLTPGKYCLIPLTKYSGDCTQYSLKVYFDAPTDELKFENKGA